MPESEPESPGAVRVPVESWTVAEAGGEGRGLGSGWKVLGMEARREWASERAEWRKEGRSRAEGMEEKGRRERLMREEGMLKLFGCVVVRFCLPYLNVP